MHDEYLLIVAIHEENGVIEEVKILNPEDNSLISAPRKVVVEFIKGGDPVFTGIKNGEGYRKGAEVEVYKEEFLRTVGNSSEGDNLENLPKY